MMIRSSKIHFLQVVGSQEVQKFSRIAMTLVFFSSESWDFILFEKIKNGAQNRAPECQFCIDWKKFNLNFTWILRVFLAPGLQELRFELRSCMSKCAQELSSSIQSTKLKFLMIFSLAGPKTWIFRIFRSTPSSFAILGAPFWAAGSRKCYHHKIQKKMKIFCVYHFCSKCTSTIVSNEMVLDSSLWHHRCRRRIRGGIYLAAIYSIEKIGESFLSVKIAERRLSSCWGWRRSSTVVEFERILNMICFLKHGGYFFYIWKLNGRKSSLLLLLKMSCLGNILW